MSYVLGIDIGTYESKGVLVDRSGNIITQTSIPHKMEVPKPGWAEHDAENIWWHDFKTICQIIINDARGKFSIHPSEINAVGASSIAPAVLPVNSKGQPLRKAILYGVDTRSEDEIKYLNKKIGEEKVFATSNQSLSSQSAGPKILWIRNNEPNTYEQTYKFLSGTGYIAYKLTNEYTIDYYTAASYSPLFNIHNMKWDHETSKYVTDLPKLPKIVWSHEIVGSITEKAAEETGLAIGTKVIAGTADALSESISVGAVNKGDLMLMYGSSTFFTLVSDSLSITKKLWPSLHAVPNLNTVTGGTSTAGSITRWFIDQLMGETQLNRDKKNIDKAYTQLTQAAETSPPGSNGLVTLPYFSGERTPIHHANAKGIMFGLSLYHTKSDMYRSILEGIGFSIRHNFDEMKALNLNIKRIVAVGGGVKSKLWLKTVSDICGIKQVIPKVTIGASYGNAFLCALAMGWYKNIEDVVEWVSIDSVINPDDANLGLYQHYYDIYKALYVKNKDLMEAL
ncbi:FGGY-family carbohydrate kinase [Fredinandcohnia onubensis]|uniref:FGGY-family carbohydrate kinase n=1 Tax=Fredinandcohnia onubensis TaxID=1571209 RepID=UPI0015D46F8E|nr:FGGY-family carbohydrate kinase [Fredinandcohnia onubensis]